MGEEAFDYPCAGRHPWLLGLGFFALYAATCATTVQGGDSGQFTLIAALGGFAHAPGYPLHSLFLTTLGALPFNPAWISALASAIWAALAVAVVAKTHKGPAGLVAGAALGVTPIFWNYAVVAEVFAGAALSFALVLYVASRIAAGARGPKWQLALGLAVATGIAHHHVIVFLAPLAFWAWWTAGWRHRTRRSRG